MSANPLRGQIEAEMGGQVRTLALPMDRLAALEKDVGLGLFVFAGIVSRHQVTVSQMQAAFYHGLLGGGWKPDPQEVKDARGAVLGYMKALGAMACVGIVSELMTATLAVGVDEEDEPEGNPAAGDDPAESTSTS